MKELDKPSWLINNYHFLFGFLITMVICYFPVFHHLSVECIRVWDEGENAVSAFEMLQNGNYIVKYYEGEPDMWSLKPPFLIWNQVFWMKVLGPNELAVRLPSAIFALFTILIIIRFCIKEFKKPEMGFFIAMILVTSQGYINRHVVRTGDHDATLIFFLISSFIYFYKYLKYQQQKTFYLTVVTLSVILAVLTKGIVGILFIPAFLIWAAIQGKLKYIFFSRSTYVAIFLFLCIAIGYYLLREHYNPGYLKAVWNDELFPRYLNRSENYMYQHNEDYWYYFRNLWQSRFVPWIYFLPASLFLIFISRSSTSLRRFIFFSILTAVIFFIIISFGTKGLWYDAPLFPLLSMWIGAGVYIIYNFLKNILNLKNKILQIFLFLLLCGSILYVPYTRILEKTYNPKEYPWDMESFQICYYLKDAIENEKNLNNLVVAYEGYHSHILFYMNILNLENSNICFKDYKELDSNDIVIASQKEVKDYIEANCQYEILMIDDPAKVYKLIK